MFLAHNMQCFQPNLMQVSNTFQIKIQVEISLWCEVSCSVKSVVETM